MQANTLLNQCVVVHPAAGQVRKRKEIKKAGQASFTISSLKRLSQCYDEFVFLSQHPIKFHSIYVLSEMTCSCYGQVKQVESRMEEEDEEEEEKKE